MSFVDQEKELVTEDNVEGDKEKKESRTKTFFRKTIIGTTIMVSLWSMGKMDSNKVEASESNTQVEQQDDLEINNSKIDDVIKRIEVIMDSKSTDQEDEKNKEDDEHKKIRERVEKMFEDLKV